MSGRKWLSAVAFIFLYALSGCSGVLPTNQRPPRWVTVASPNPGSGYNALVGITKVSADNLWAVGYHADTNRSSQTLIERWNGSSWSVVSSPNASSASNELIGAAAVSANDIWAVGYYSPNSNSYKRLLFEHWNGSSWTVVSGPNPGSGDNELVSVAALSANNIWAVGDWYNTDGGPYQSLVEHWDGSSWTVVPNPNPGSSVNELSSIVALSPNNIWAVGNYRNIGEIQNKTLIEHWNGSSWSVVSSPNPGSGGNLLFGVAAIASNDIWAVGYYQTPNGPNHTLIEHWNGSSWMAVSSPNPGTGGGALSDVAVVAANDIWAIGTYTNSLPGTGGHTLLEHWNGSSWTEISGPSLGQGYNSLSGIVALSSDDVWVVGGYKAGNTPHQTFIEHWTRDYSSSGSSPVPTTS